jgi:Smg protein
MNEDIFDVLIYLFENYIDSEINIIPDTDLLKTELKAAGFNNKNILKAFEWLDTLALQKDPLFKSTKNFRIFCKEEIQKLDLECRGFILFLEHLNILTPTSRELVIDRVMAIENQAISIEELKWIALIVLLSQPDEELAIAHMENIIYHETSTLLN